MAKYTIFPKTRQELAAAIHSEYDTNGLDADLNHIDTSAIKDMSYIFYASDFCGDISGWDVSNVTNMKGILQAVL